MTWPEIAPDLRRQRLMPPAGRGRVLLDTDIANEIDDPFAIAHAVLSPERIELEAITLAPFRREGLTAADSQQLNEVLGRQTLEALGSKLDLTPGAQRFGEAPDDRVDSPAVEIMLRLAEADSEPLYIMAIGAVTNVASALRREPELVRRVVVLWLGGHAPDVAGAAEYNVLGDVHAARTLLDSGVPLVRFPAWGVTSHLLVSLAALERDLVGSPLGDFLTGLLREHVSDHFAHEKELWDVACIAWCVDPGAFRSVLEPTPGIADNLDWHVRMGPLHRRITFLDRNRILRDLLTKVRGHSL